MEKLHESLNKKRKRSIVITYAFIIFSGCFMFPLNLSQYNLFGLLILVTYSYIALFLYALYTKKPLFVFFSTFLFNSIGLLFRVILEWGEAYITKSLTPFNVGIYLSLVPVLVTIIYLLIQIYESQK